MSVSNTYGIKRNSSGLGDTAVVTSRQLFCFHFFFFSSKSRHTSFGLVAGFQPFALPITLTLREREKKRQIPERKIRNFQFWEKEKEITKGNFHSNWNIFSFGFFFSNNKSEIKRSFLTFVLRLIFDQRKRNKSISLFNNHSFFFLFCCC